jgi:formamidopyrimidine-DNA glycosylase
MPELPEVETVRRGLAKFLPGKAIEQVVVLHPRATRKSEVSLTDCVGARIDGVNRRGKYLWFK